MSSPRPILDDMPLHIKKQIFESIEPQYRVPCRLLSKSIKSLIDKMPFVIEKLEVSVYPSDSSIDFHLFSGCTYTQKEGNVNLIHRNRVSKIIEDIGLFKLVSDRLNLIFQIPHLELNELSINFGNGSSTQQSVFLSMFQLPIVCKSLSVWLLRANLNSELPRFLRLVRPGSLKHLNLGFIRYRIERSLYMGTVAEMEVFKKAKTLKIGFHTTGIRLADVKHFEKCHFYPTDFTVEEIKELKTMCLEEGKTNFHINLKEIDLNAVTAAFGAYTDARKQSWRFSSRENNSCFEMRVYTVMELTGMRFGCEINLKKL